MPQEADADKPKLIDGSDALFSMYNRRAKMKDEKMTERWKGDAEGILLFTGLFSAAVAQFLVGSLQNLQSNPQDASSFDLAHIYQLTPGSNASSIPLPPDPAQFQTPKFAVWTNTLWSLSLVMSLTCALLATLLQQWARRYLRITQKTDDPQRRARIRELMLQGSKKRLPLRLMLELLTALLHTAVFLFLAGFVIYLFHFNCVVGAIVAVSVGTCVSLYLWISFAPIIFRDSPYYTPLSSLVWVISMGVIWLGLQLRYSAALSTRCPEAVPKIRQSLQKYYQRITKGITKEVEDMAQSRSSHLDTSVISGTFNTLDGDRDMEQFLAGVPGFYNSVKVNKDRYNFERLNSKQLPASIISFLDHSLSSDLLSESSKQERIENCLKAIHSNPLLLECTFRQALLSTSHSAVFKCVDFVHLTLAQSHNNDVDPRVREYARCVVAVAINRISDYNDKWTGIIQRHLGLPESRMNAYRSQTDSVRLCNLIHLIRQFKLNASRLRERGDFGPEGVWHNSMMEARRLEAANAAPELQHEFCALWNELARVAKGQEPEPVAPQTARLNTMHILSVIRNVYIPLHGVMGFLPDEYHDRPRDDDDLLESAPSYPVCHDPNHHRNQVEWPSHTVIETVFSNP
ncbi:hypothetical protein BJV78DRAFT_1282032 [Lactifluus subvellereus]|nr:hypothetical protein BJV78DRAFT_1282032 [Lactifluus subvellereus]